LFNHESPRRGETFVTRKITSALANIIAGKQYKLYLGNLDAKRDWGFAPEYAVCQWLMLQQNEPDDFVIGTGESHSVRDFVELAFEYAGIRINWQGRGLDEKGIISSIDKNISSKVPLKVGDVIIEIDQRYFRPAEVDHLLADSSKAMKKLNWESKVTFNELVKIMVDADMELVGVNSPGESSNILILKNIGWTTNKITVK
ncbi:MAG: GDP-mannose 4,6-dehydratase, partial [Candidatus Hodarchaeales archaeon]